MTPQELEAARAEIGRQWNLGGPLSAADLGRLLRLINRDPGAQVREWERGQTKGGVPGPVAAFVDALLGGYVPPGAPQGSAAPMDRVSPEERQPRNRRRN